MVLGLSTIISQGKTSTTIRHCSSAYRTSSCCRCCASFKNFSTTSLPPLVFLCRIRLLHSCHSNGNRSTLRPSSANEERFPIFSLISIMSVLKQKITLRQRHHSHWFTGNVLSVYSYFVVLWIHINLWRLIV